MSILVLRRGQITLGHVVLAVLLLINFKDCWRNIWIVRTLEASIPGWGLRLLTVVIRLIILRTVQKLIKLEKFLKFLVLNNLLILLIFFTLDSFLFFYVFFELSLIPIFFIIIGWGYQPERVRAAFWIIFYTLSAALLFLIFIITTFKVNGIVSFSLSNLHILPARSSEGNTTRNMIFPLTFILAIIAKLPLYSLHLWLPRAHVEAPVFGSVLLAAILLKLAGFGMWKFSWLIPNNLATFLRIFALTGGAVVRIICLGEKDRKKLIAYSSVAHIAFVAGGYLSKSSIGRIAALLFMFAHGVCSSGLFIGRYVIYMLRGRRSFYLRFGYLRAVPVFAIFWAFFCMSRIGMPPTSNFFREILCIMALFNSINTFFIPVSILCFLAAGYSLILYSNLIHGQGNVIQSICMDTIWILRFLRLIIWSIIVLFIV